MMKALIYILAFIPILVIGQDVISEEYELYNDSIYLPGTLTYPKADKKVPLVIFIHGSGNGDRNGNQGSLAKADHIKQLADSLNVKGIAFYRYDKRSATPSNFKKMNMEDFRLRDLAKDASVAVNKFKGDGRFSSIHLIGHSQGSLVGMLAVSDKVDSYISLAGPGTTIDVSLVRQLTEQNEDMGKVAKEHLSELVETDTIGEVHFMLMSIFAPINQKFLKDWILLDPSEEIKKLKVPVMIINGDSDIQITTEDAQLLKKAKPDAKLVIIKKMNHMLKTVESSGDNQKSYYNPEYPLSSELVRTITEFIHSHG